MSTSNASYDESVQIVKDVMDKTLIDKVVAELSASSLPTSATITTRYPWTAACEELLQYYVKNVHLNAIKEPKIAAIVKPPRETGDTFRLIERINTSKMTTRRIPLPGDYYYHILIPLVLKGLPRQIAIPSINKLQEIPWTEGCVVYLKKGTALICSTDGGGAYILMGGKNKA